MSGGGAAPLGAALTTVTSKATEASRLSGSEAVTVIVADPRASARTVTTLPATSAAATAESEDAAP